MGTKVCALTTKLEIAIWHRLGEIKYIYIKEKLCALYDYVGCIYIAK